MPISSPTRSLTLDAYALVERARVEPLSALRAALIWCAADAQRWHVEVRPQRPGMPDSAMIWLVIDDRGVEIARADALDEALETLFVELEKMSTGPSPIELAQHDLERFADRRPEEGSRLAAVGLATLTLHLEDLLAEGAFTLVENGQGWSLAQWEEPTDVRDEILERWSILRAASAEVAAELPAVHFEVMPVQRFRASRKRPWMTAFAVRVLVPGFRERRVVVSLDP